jgi:peptidoglycan/LPS O-acetylase OafA/YrhL
MGWAYSLYRDGAMTHITTDPAATTLVPTHVLDFMRGFAAVYVVINHVRGSFFKGGSRTFAEAVEPLGLYDYLSIAILQFTSLGTEFVILFFCVSGFAMAHSMSHSTSTIQFYQRRLIRIWPPYLIAIGLAAFVCVLYGWVDPGSRISERCAERLCTAEGLLLMAAYVEVSTPMTAQFWSLPYEVIFYILCPVLLLSRSLIPFFLGLSIFISIIGLTLYGLDLNPSSSVLINFAINALFWFMSGAVAYHYIGFVPAMSSRKFLILAVFLILSILIVKITYGGPNFVSNLLMIAFSIICIRNLPRTWTSFPLSNWGFFSYSIYIYHMAFILLIELYLKEEFNIQAGDIESYWAWTLVLPVVLFGCWCMYFIGEKQCNMLLKQMKRSRSKVHA